MIEGNNPCRHHRGFPEFLADEEGTT